MSELLLAWEEARARGQEMTAAELCRECPDLTLSLEGRIKALRAVSAVLDLGPYSDDPTPPGGGQPHGEVGELPGHVLVQELGRGGSGAVYKARQVGLDRVVAVKVLLGGHYAGEVALSRFRAEARALARLRHPNIVPIHDVGTHHGAPYYVMEFLDGGNLAELLDARPLEPAEAARVTELLARTVHAVHQAGIIHRDLKPANVLLQAVDPHASHQPAGAVLLRGRWYVPKLTDFGLARGAEGDGELTASGVSVGTPAFMSPEQAQGRRGTVGLATDVYSLGVLLYQLMTGTLPFNAEAAWETVQQVITRKPEPPSRRARVPPALDTICMRCLEKDPAKRYPSAEALADDLHRFLTGRAPARPARSWRRWGAVAAALMFVVAGAGLLAAWFANRPEETVPPEPPPPPWRVAIVTPNTGPGSEGQAIRDGVRLAVEELKEKGVRIEVVDPDETTAVAAAERAIGEGKANLLIGGATPEERKALAAVAQKHDQLLMVPVPCPGYETYPNAVFLGPTGGQYAEAAKGFIDKETAEKSQKATAVVLGDGKDLSRIAAETLRARMKLPPRGLSDRVFYFDDPDGPKKHLLLALADLEPPRFAVCIGYDHRSAALLSDLAQSGPEAHWLLIDIRAEASTKDLEQHHVITAFALTRGTKPSAFAGRFEADKSLRSRKPTETTASAYAAVHLWAEAARRAKSPHTPRVREHLGGLHFDGLGHAVVLEANEPYARRAFGVYRILADTPPEAVFATAALNTDPLLAAKMRPAGRNALPSD
jgi:serine/threonine-protein kinase